MFMPFFRRENALRVPLAREVRASPVEADLTGFSIGLLAVILGVAALFAVWSRWRRQMGGGFGPTEFSDGSMTTEPTGYPEEMHGHGKKISPTDNNAADYRSKSDDEE
jgi:hypothetical protein